MKQSLFFLWHPTLDPDKSRNLIPTFSFPEHAEPILAPSGQTTLGAFLYFGVWNSATRNGAAPKTLDPFSW